MIVGDCNRAMSTAPDRRPSGSDVSRHTGGGARKTSAPGSASAESGTFDLLLLRQGRQSKQSVTSFSIEVMTRNHFGTIAQCPENVTEIKFLLMENLILVQNERWRRG